MKSSFNAIQVAVNETLNIKSLIRRKKKTQVEKKRELFIMLVNSIEQVINRQNLMYADLNLDLTKYDESFLEIIDGLLLLHFGKDNTELITFYLWDRLTHDGEITPLIDQAGNKLYLRNPEDLWNLIISLSSSDE